MSVSGGGGGGGGTGGGGTGGGASVSSGGTGRGDGPSGRDGGVGGAVGGGESAASRRARGGNATQRGKSKKHQQGVMVSSEDMDGAPEHVVRTENKNRLQATLESLGEQAVRLLRRVLGVTPSAAYDLVRHQYPEALMAPHVGLIRRGIQRCHQAATNALIHHENCLQLVDFVHRAFESCAGST